MLCIVFLACGTDVGESRCESSAGIEKVISVLAIRIPYPGNFACIVGKQKTTEQERLAISLLRIICLDIAFDLRLNKPTDQLKQCIQTWVLPCEVVLRFVQSIAFIANCTLYS